MAILQTPYGTSLIRKTVFFRALPEKGGEGLARIFLPFSPPCCPLYFDINIMLCDTFWSFLTPKSSKRLADPVCLLQRCIHTLCLTGFLRIFRKGICLLFQKLPSFLPTGIYEGLLLFPIMTGSCFLGRSRSMCQRGGHSAADVIISECLRCDGGRSEDLCVAAAATPLLLLWVSTQVPYVL